MKFLIVVLVACVALVAGQTPSQKLENTINDLKQQMPCGFPDLDIPPLAPYRGDFFDLYHKLWILKINGGINTFVIFGLENFDIIKVNLNVLTLKINVELEFKDIHAWGKYSIESFFVKFLKVRGRGDFDFKLKDLRIGVDARIGMVDGVLRMMDFDLKIALDKIKSKITGLLIGPLGSLALSSIVDKVISNYIRDNSEDISNNLGEILVPQINEQMKDLTIRDVLDLLQKPRTPAVCIPPGA